MKLSKMSKMKYKRTKEVAHLENYQKHKYSSIPGGGILSRVLN
jgi:hypothetical protein